MFFVKETCPIAACYGYCNMHSRDLHLFGDVVKLSNCPFDENGSCNVVDDAPAILQKIKESSAYIAQQTKVQKGLCPMCNSDHWDLIDFTEICQCAKCGFQWKA